MELALRVVSALIGIPLALMIIWQGGTVFSATVLLIALRGAYELVSTLRSKGVEVVKEAVYPAIAVMVFSPHFLSRNDLGLLYAAVLLTLIAGSLAFHVFVPPSSNPSPDPRFQSGVVLSAGSTALTGIYMGLFAFFVLMRQLHWSGGTVPEEQWELGARLLIMAFAVTWSVDAGAYFIGRWIGRNKLAPRVSPGKTIEGAIGGWLCGIAVAMLAASLFRLPLFHGAVIGALAGVAGQLGDLCKSAIKRDAGIKDFPHLIPGHGGVIDRFDSLLFNVPLVYLYATCWMGLSSP